MIIGQMLVRKGEVYNQRITAVLAVYITVHWKWDHETWILSLLNIQHISGCLISNIEDLRQDKFLCIY